MLNPNIKLPLGSDRIALKERFANFEKRNPEWLLTTLGARVWTDENGEMIIVGFGASSASTLKSADKQQAILYAQTEIGRFVSESWKPRTQPTASLRTGSWRAALSRCLMRTVIRSGSMRAPRQFLCAEPMKLNSGGGSTLSQV